MVVVFCTISFSSLDAASFVRFLESNTFVFRLGDIKIFSDPVMSQLDFGIPAVYRGRKKYINGATELENEAKTSDLVLISQGFDDHAHTPTLKKLSALRPDMPYICPPSAVAILTACGIPQNCITTISHGQKLEFGKANKKAKIEIRATQGALLGPPWQTKENGYIFRPAPSTSMDFPSLYYEPHCMFDEAELRQAGTVDYVVTPVVQQVLPAYTLVDGGARAIELANVLGAKCVIPMMNGELEQAGVLSKLVRKVGSVDEFMSIASRQSTPLKVLLAPPGEEIPLQPISTENSNKAFSIQQ